MSLLTSTDLERLIVDDNAEKIEDKNIIISPIEKPLKKSPSLTPVGYDLRVGEKVVFSNKIFHKKLSKGKNMSISPGATALITTLESVTMPRDGSLSALIESKVSHVSRGLSHISTTVDADWKGNLLIAIHNHSKKRQKLEFGERFCTIVFIENSSPPNTVADKPSGRLDILMKKFEQENYKAAIIGFFMNLIPPLVVIFFVFLGLNYIKDNTMLPVVVAGGIAIAQFIQAAINAR